MWATLWEQMRLCYEYGIDDLWILNVGDLKPMEHPIDLFLKMAWRPDDYADISSVHQHALDFCAQMLGENNLSNLSNPSNPSNLSNLSREAARLLETYLRYNSRVTPELLNWRTYNLQSGEWEQAMLQYKALEADAYRLWQKVPAQARDAYHQLILFPIQSMANLYEMYYAQAQNLYLAALGDPRANCYADLVEQCFARDAELTREYHSIGGGKWNHLMDQTHIGYRSWQQPDVQVCPKVFRVDADKAAKPEAPHYVFKAYNGQVSMEAEHYFEASPSADGTWTILPTLGRTLSGVALLPHNAACEGASLDYAFRAEGFEATAPCPSCARKAIAIRFSSTMARPLKSTTTAATLRRTPTRCTPSPPPASSRRSPSCPSLPVTSTTSPSVRSTRVSWSKRSSSTSAATIPRT